MIGVFDSGFGGLTILSAFLRKMPTYDYLIWGTRRARPMAARAKRSSIPTPAKRFISFSTEDAG